MITLLSKYKLQNKAGKAQMIIGFILVLLYLFSVIGRLVLACINKNPWFDWGGYFTTQGSIVCLVFLISWIINFYKPLKILRSDLFLLFATTYVTFISIGYTFIFIGELPYENKWWLEIGFYMNILIHFVCPWTMAAFYILNSFIKKSPGLAPIKYHSIFWGLIFPLVYAAMLVYTFFFWHISEYGYYTAFWSFIDCKNGDLSPIAPGSWIRLFFLPIWTIVMCGQLSLMWYFDKYVTSRKK
jgi:hypothetical protein